MNIYIKRFHYFLFLKTCGKNTLRFLNSQNHFVLPVLSFFIFSFLVFPVFLKAFILYAAEEKHSLVAPESQMSDFEARMEIAKMLTYNEDTLDDALKEFSRLLKETPGNVELHMEIARILKRQGDFQRSSATLDAVLEKHP